MGAANMEEALDSLINLDLNQRGVAHLHYAALERVGRPLAGAAAEELAGLAPGARVLMTTGLAVQPWVSTALIENDGPAGTVALARALALGIGAIPILLAEAETLSLHRAMAQAAGLIPVEEAVPDPGNIAVCEVLPFPHEEQAARLAAAELLDRTRPGALISVERVGPNERGVLHNARGEDIGLGKARLDLLFAEAARRSIPTVGVGDGGNELGMGLVAGAVRDHVPFGDLCRCGCGGGIGAATATDVLVTAGVSNWACYAIAAVLAVRLGMPDLLHTPEAERRLLRRGAELGLLDGVAGVVGESVDALPASTHVAMVELVERTARRELERRAAG